MSLRGRCLCGAVAYTLDATVETLNICHCNQCKAANGSAFQPVIVADEADVAFDEPPHVTEYESSPGKHRAFCTRCGAPIYSRRDDLPDTLRLRAGLIADLPELKTLVQAFEDEAWAWLPRLTEVISQEQNATEEVVSR